MPTQLNAISGRCRRNTLQPPDMIAASHGRWVDAQATNVESTAAGVRGLDSPAVVLLGGQAKKDPAGAGLGFGRLAPLMHRHRAVVTVRP